jgi:transposase
MRPILPPYSPDFNPIEETFHFIKTWLCRHNDEAFDPAAHPWLIHHAIMAVTSDYAEAWYKNCGYV